MNRRPKIEERYTKGGDVINFVVYRSTTGAGDDQVLQHKIMGITETAHITLHPDGTINFRTKRRGKTMLERAVRTGLVGYSPKPSQLVQQFLTKVCAKI